MESNLQYFKPLEWHNSLDKCRESRVFAVIDLKVKNFLPQWLQFSPDVFWMKSPEEQKNFQTYQECCEFLLSQGIQRSSKIFAIGGGATTDLAGFVASSIHRGVEWIAIPTTLIGMVDAAIGGKVSINAKMGKNLIGAFYQPSEVWISTEFLKSLPRTEMMSGKGEIVKYALLSESIYNLCLSKNFSLDQVIIECSKYKQKIVQSDFKDQNIRSILNLGHTIGHALEVELKIPHGVAVLMGMKYLFKAMGFKDSLEKFEIVCKKLEIDLEKLELTEYSKFDFDRFWTYLGFDKKRTNGSVKLVLVKKLGEPFTENITLTDLRSRLESLSDFSR